MSAGRPTGTEHDVPASPRLRFGQVRPRRVRPVDPARRGGVGDCGLTWQTVDGVADLEVGYHVLPAWQGSGLATEAAAASRDLARSPGVERLIAIVHPDNLASQRVATKIGLSLDRRTVSSGGLPVHVFAAQL